MAMEGWLRHLRKKSKRCWLLSAFLCISCGKKITDKNRGKKKVVTGKTQLKPVKEQLLLNFESALNLHTASHFFDQRAFYKIPEKINISQTSEETALYFQVVEDRYEFVCYYSKQDFEECRDEKGILIDHLQPGKTIHMIEGKEFYVETQGIAAQQASIQALFTVNP